MGVGDICFVLVGLEFFFFSCSCVWEDLCEYFNGGVVFGEIFEDRCRDNCIFGLNVLKLSLGIRIGVLF